MTGSRKLTLEVVGRSDHSHHVEVQLSAVILNCTCDSNVFVFNSSLASAFFQSPEYPKKHCKMTSCQRTFILPVELRKQYKMKLSEFYFHFSTISFQEGPNEILIRDKYVNRPFAFESPTVTLRYEPGEEQGEIYSLEMALIERQDGCECPHQPNIATNLFVEIPTHCKDVDCRYLLPEIDDNTVEYHVQSEYFNDFITGRSRSEGSYQNSFEAEGSGTWTFDEGGRILIRVYRKKASLSPTVFNLTYTTSGTHISHAERCNCVNKTILLESNQAMDVTSPHWPSHYCDNLVCVTTFIAPAHHHLEVKLATISLEPDLDRVAFFDGTNVTGKHIEVVTGELLIPDPIVSSDTVMTMVFVSNGAVAFDGFNSTITAVMDKTWPDHLQHHFSGWWWLLAVIGLLSIGGAVLFLRIRR